MIYVYNITMQDDLFNVNHSLSLNKFALVFLSCSYCTYKLFYLKFCSYNFRRYLLLFSIPTFFLKHLRKNQHLFNVEYSADNNNNNNENDNNYCINRDLCFSEKLIEHG